MAISGLSKRKSELYSLKTIQCKVRKIPVPSDPEEKVRQALLHKMVDTLGFPLGLIAVEKSLSSLPHLIEMREMLPIRRADILVFGKEIHPQASLYPLILIECKAAPLSPKVLRQVAGYNRFVKSFFITVANEEEIMTGWWNSALKDYEFVPFLPPYQDLLSSLSSCKSII